MTTSRHAPTGHSHATPFAAKPLLVCALVIAILLMAWPSAGRAASEIDVPYIGEPADRSLSPLEETKLGSEVMRQLLAHHYLLEDPQLEDYIGSLGQQLLDHTNEQQLKFRFFIMRDNAINAFALPGGFIGINAGLLLASETESELAGVMGHEIAHVTQRHIARSMDDTRGWNVAAAALMIAAVIAGAHDPELAQAALGMGMSAAIQKQINFTRANELEADRLGIKTLSKAGFDPLGMASFFHRLSQNAQLYGEGVPEILRTHPVNSTRVSEARARAASLPTVPAKPSLRYELMQARARVLMTELSSESVAHFQALEKNQSAPAHRYGLALAHIRSRAFADAKTELDALIAQDPAEISYSTAMAELHLQSGNYPQAIEQTRKALKKHQNDRALLLMLSDSLIRNDKPALARQTLLESALLNRDDSEAYRLMAMAARDMKQPAEAHFQLAAYAHSRGDYYIALRQLHNGLRISDLQEHDRNRLQGRLDQYLAEIPESERKRAEAEQRRERQTQ